MPTEFTPGFEVNLFGMEIGIVILNTLGVVVAVFFTKKMDLYADLPDILPNLPAFGPEVSL